MKFFSKITIVITLAFAFSLISGIAIGQEKTKMTMDEYKAQLQDWQAREAKAKQAGVDCSAEVEKLKADVATTQSEVDKEWADILGLIGTDQAGVDAYKAKLDGLEGQVDGLLALSPEELFKKRDEIKAAEASLAELKKDKISVLTEMQNQIAAIEGKITQAKNKMPKAVYDEYTVLLGDYLWKISGKPDIYKDPMQWMRIYSYNKDQIKDPDLIYANQIFKIQREVGPDEYLVAKGDYLAKIAGNANVLSDPTKWTKVYEKNKDIIGENPNLVFPYTVLVIPRE
jgi:nucleoid-associated protein YgaU